MSYQLPQYATLLPPNSYYATDPSSHSEPYFGRRAMSVMSSSSYRYSPSTHDLLDDNTSIHSAPLAPDDTVYLSKQDLSSSIDAYEDLLSAAKVYREQMVKLSSAAAGFGFALEKMARSKTASEAGQGLQAAAGLQFLISNHQQILSDMFYKSFEAPLLENLDHHRSTVQQSQANYDDALKTMSHKIRQTEANNLKNGRKGKRDIRQFRKALQELTCQVDELDRIKSNYHKHMVDLERRNHHLILGKVAVVVRAQVDIFERISNKGLADPILEQMMQQHPDPFCAYSTTTDESAQIFTVLPPVSLIEPQTPALSFGDPEDYEFNVTSCAKEPSDDGVSAVQLVIPSITNHHQSPASSIYKHEETWEETGTSSGPVTVSDEHGEHTSSDSTHGSHQSWSEVPPDDTKP
ncbi:uncharacterized protein BYT42DRAFT_552561 [Radiomyces spectabilis]|uniref:uncharacterized protein n=1 Tax=Radiomyces spectabilis TaxID=64574 RepID=UPI00221F07ED|nr:uncharacterized protein BYT42DRAFT_552561 [Radiomyces spectabilis]KAI8393888.1 hypothetical protein BYT42DRAFT_552561 [Radiomyces spectabilis]